MMFCCYFFLNLSPMYDLHLILEPGYWLLCWRPFDSITTIYFRIKSKNNTNVQTFYACIELYLIFPWSTQQGSSLHMIEQRASWPKYRSYINHFFLTLLAAIQQYDTKTNGAELFNWLINGVKVKVCNRSESL